jgi:hypothetical protein
MTVLIDDTGAVTRDEGSRIHWPAVIAGALTAAALALVLHAFAAAIGLAVSSTAPTWRDSSATLALLSGLYLLLVALASYGFGAYIAGWIKSWSSLDAVDDTADTNDGLHGLIVWSLATLITAAVVAMTLLGASQLAAPSGGNAGPGASVGSENIIAYDIDRLLRADGRAPQGDPARVRSEAGRILLTASGHSGVSTEDRQYLNRLVVAQTGLSPPDAERRVDATIVRVRDNIRKARRSAVILAFMAGAAAMVGAAAAWFAAGAGARHSRDPAATPIWGRQTTFSGRTAPPTARSVP